MPMKNSNDTVGNRTRYFPACSAVPPQVRRVRVDQCVSSVTAAEVPDSSAYVVAVVT
jgi:hypothetical protein